MSGTVRRIYKRLRRSDERIMETRFGWLLPGGAAYKLGQRDKSQSTRRSAYLIGFLLQGPIQGLLDGWNYNVGRERAQRRRERRHDTE